MKFYIQLFFANSIDALITLADRYVFHGDLEKIIEVTYSYREIDEGYFLNETLFEEYLELSYPQYNLSYLGRRYKYKVQVQIVLIDDILKKLSKVTCKSRNEGLKKGIFGDALMYVKRVLEISVLALEFELEKAGEYHGLSQKQIQSKIKQIELREKEVFGKKVIEHEDEFSSCYNFILANHKSKKKSLPQRDQKLIEKYLKKIRAATKCTLQETPTVTKKYLRGKFLKVEIPRKDYRKIFDSVCELYGLPQRTKITNAGSIYDGDNFLEIPRNEAHATFPIERILKLLTHEIESHYINSYNGKILIGKFRGAKNLPKEEGLAMFMEKIFLGYDYENIDNIVEYFFTIMAGEVLAGDEFVDFMRIMGKEYACKRNYEVSVMRAKRNYIRDFPGVQHKDVVYFRGLTELLEYLKGGGDFQKLFLGKVGFHDLENIYDIYHASDKKEDIVFPIFISDVIYYYFSEKSRSETFEFSIPEYYLYLKKKYWFIDIESFRIIDHMNAKWKKIERIIKMFEKFIVEEK